MLQKLLLVGLAFLTITPSVFAQRVLFEPIKLVPNKIHDSEPRLLETTGIGIRLSLQGVFFYLRNDSSFIAFWHKGVLQEFILPEIWMIDRVSTYGVEFVENVGTNDLIIIKTKYSFSSPGSSRTVNWREHETTWTIIDLASASVVFDYEIVKYRFEASHLFEKDIYDPNLSNDEVNRLFEEATTDTSEFGYAYELDVEKTQLRLTAIVHYNVGMYEPPPFAEGLFELKNGVFTRVAKSTD